MMFSEKCPLYPHPLISIDMLEMSCRNHLIQYQAIQYHQCHLHFDVLQMEAETLFLEAVNSMLVAGYANKHLGTRFGRTVTVLVGSRVAHFFSLSPSSLGVVILSML